MFFVCEVCARAVAVVFGGMLVCIVGLTQCSHPIQEDAAVSVFSPRMEWMFDDELMQEVELAPRGITAEVFNRLPAEKQEELFQLYVKYYHVHPTIAHAVTLRSYRELPVSQRAAIEEIYVKTYAAEYPASPQKMIKRFFGNSPLPWLVAYNRIKAQGLLKGIKAKSDEALFSLYSGSYSAAAHYEIYRAAILNPAGASRETRKAICAMLNWGHNGRRFDGEGYLKILYFAKPEGIESLGIQKKTVHYNDEDWEIYSLTD